MSNQNAQSESGAVREGRTSTSSQDSHPELAIGLAAQAQITLGAQVSLTTVGTATSTAHDKVQATTDIGLNSAHHIGRQIDQPIHDQVGCFPSHAILIVPLRIACAQLPHYCVSR